MLTAEEERRHLQEGPRPGEEPRGVGTILARATCAGDAGAVLARAREALDPVLSHLGGRWPADEEWPRVLPDWLVRASAPEPTDAEAKAQLARWQRLSQDEQAREAATAAWTLLNWVYWFCPEDRQWWWWNACVQTPDVALVEVQIDGWPAPTGALCWLLRAAGAVEVTVEG